MSTRLAAAAAVTLALTLSACSSDPETVTIGGTQAAASTQTVKRPWGEVRTAPKMVKAESPNAADLTFATDMIGHHRQAIELSRNLLSHSGVEDRIDASASFIVQDQKNEITTMKAWLQAWSEAAPDGEHEEHDASSMPGMLPQERVDEIRSLDADDAQIAFLLAMIEHHEGAIEMSKDYLPEQQNSFTRSTAQHIIAEQLTEVQYMQNLVVELCEAEGAPATCPDGR